MWDAVNPESIHTEEELQVALVQTANTGMIIQESLFSWNSDFQTWNIQSPASEFDSRSMLAKVYYHATSIYLSGLFDYRFHYNEIPNPTLTFEAVQSHVNGILSTTLVALRSTNLSGVLFLFPLRVAGARAVSVDHKKLILSMLKEVSGRNFVVANAFVVDLEDLWDINGP